MPHNVGHKPNTSNASQHALPDSVLRVGRQPGLKKGSGYALPYLNDRPGGGHFAALTCIIGGK